ncbi:MAG: hypothetical protein LLF28_07935 [Nitrospiraceae bacterium]|nr:hypothetical protein [Nitrospiraceae bacterium]
MENFCKDCKYGCETKPTGIKPQTGTVWCSHRGMQMGLNRQMPCFVPLKIKKNHCFSCKHAKITKPSGESPSLGNIWCDKKREEINKQRMMDCFEQI